MYRNFSREAVDEMYKLKHIDAYEPLPESSGWLVCGNCGVLPRAWRFNNGCFATCLCFRMYEDHPARAESILSYYKRNDSTKDYTRDNLRLAWNKYVETGEMQNKLPEGQW